MTKTEVAELGLTRALQRYDSAKTACLAMHGSLSILVVPQDDFKVLAAASFAVVAARNRLGDIQARARAERSMATRFPLLLSVERILVVLL